MSISVMIHPSYDCGWRDLRHELRTMEEIEIQADTMCRSAILTQVRESAPDIFISGINSPVEEELGFLLQIRDAIPSQTKILLVLAKVDPRVASFVLANRNLDALLWSDLPLTTVSAFVRFYSTADVRIVGLEFLGLSEDLKWSNTMRLTLRQQMIVGHLAAGLSYAEIANSMHVSYRTVAREVERLMNSAAASSLFQLGWRLSMHGMPVPFPISTLEK